VVDSPCYRLASNFGWRGHAGTNIIHIQGANPSVGSLSEMNAIAAAYIAWLDSDLQPLTSADLAWDSVEITSLQGTPRFVQTYTSGMPLVGGVVSTSVPNSSALVVTLRTGYSGRSFRGRVYLGGTPLSVMDSANLVDGSHAAALDTAFTGLQSDMAAIDCTIGVLSLIVAGIPRIEGEFTPVLNFTVNTKLDTQRRRMKDAI